MSSVPKIVIVSGGAGNSAELLIANRMQRQATLGVTRIENVAGISGYVDPLEIEDELRAAKRLFRLAGFRLLDMTDKTIEMGADEIQRQVTLTR